MDLSRRLVWSRASRLGVLSLAREALGAALEPYLADTLQGGDVGDDCEQENDSVKDVAAEQQADHRHDHALGALEQARPARKAQALGSRADIRHEERPARRRRTSGRRPRP